ncbi:hypothetical protein CC78DRAFT_572304 [Lojkania enalia]|uniref:CBM1 domain-containing protein n=1 Tax=Lojkania enalia TaxID=147567 RepID=A0A9P4JYA2_9PLEO|nr:hypothetical protein CC78DRAFT_572304 [Didymosphaeria enalia]
MMGSLALILLFISISTLSLAAPHNPILEERQRDKTYTITCLGPSCTDYPPTTLDLPTTFSIPGGNPNPSPTSTPKSTFKSTPTPTSTPPPTTKKTSSPPTSKYTPPPETTPTKTIKSSQKPPTKTSSEETGPSSTRCPVPLYYQCGGYYNGAKCVVQNYYYYQCVADE